MSSFSSLYDSCQEVLEKVENSEDFQFDQCLEQVISAISLIESAVLFSKNEELEDISTNSLKVLNMLVVIIVLMILVVKFILHFEQGL